MRFRVVFFILSTGKDVGTTVIPRHPVILSEMMRVSNHLKIPQHGI